MSQTAERGRQQVGAGTAGNVVENDRQGRMFRYGFEVLVQPLLRRFVVVGCDAQDRIRAPQVEFAQLVEHFRGRVAAYADHQRHAACDVVFDEHGDHGPFVQVEGRGFGRRAECDDEIHAAVDDVVDRAGQSRIIHPSVGCERGGDGCAGAAEFVSCHIVDNVIFDNYILECFRDFVLFFESVRGRSWPLSAYLYPVSLELPFRKESETVRPEPDERRSDKGGRLYYFGFLHHYFRCQGISPK